MTLRARTPWLARGTWISLMALLAWQASLGIHAELARALDVPLAERAAALGSRTDWRYRNVLGADYPLLLTIRAQVRPDTVVVLVHDGTQGSVESMALLTGLL